MVYLPESEPIQSRNTKMVHEIIALEQLLTLMASLTPFVKGFNQVNTPQSYHKDWCFTKKIEACLVLHYVYWWKENWTELFSPLYHFGR